MSLISHGDVGGKLIGEDPAKINIQNTSSGFYNMADNINVVSFSNKHAFCKSKAHPYNFMEFYMEKNGIYLSIWIPSLTMI